MLVDAITGGNPDLQSRPPNGVQARRQLAAVRRRPTCACAPITCTRRIDRPISNIIVTQAIEAAFPERFVAASHRYRRLDAGQLISVDLRPVNFDSSRARHAAPRFRFLQAAEVAPTVASRDRPDPRSNSASVGARRQRRRSAGAAPPAGPPPEAGGPPAAGRRRRFGGGRGGGGGFFGGGNRGRLQFSLTDTITFVDKVTIRPGVPELDYLHGDAAGQAGGTPRHHVEAQAGWSNNGLGARIGANWRSGTRVSTR